MIKSTELRPHSDRSPRITSHLDSNTAPGISISRGSYQRSRLVNRPIIYHALEPTYEKDTFASSEYLRCRAHRKQDVGHCIREAGSRRYYPWHITNAVVLKEFELHHCSRCQLKRGCGLLQPFLCPAEDDPLFQCVIDLLHWRASLSMLKSKLRLQLDDPFILRPGFEVDLENFESYRKHILRHHILNGPFTQKSREFIDTHPDFRPTVPGFFCQFELLLKECHLALEEYEQAEKRFAQVFPELVYLVGLCNRLQHPQWPPSWLYSPKVSLIGQKVAILGPEIKTYQHCKTIKAHRKLQVGRKSEDSHESGNPNHKNEIEHQFLAPTENRIDWYNRLWSSRKKLHWSNDIGKQKEWRRYRNLEAYFEGTLDFVTNESRSGSKVYSKYFGGMPLNVLRRKPALLARKKVNRPRPRSNKILLDFARRELHDDLVEWEEDIWYETPEHEPSLSRRSKDLFFNTSDDAWKGVIPPENYIGIVIGAKFRLLRFLREGHHGNIYAAEDLSYPCDIYEAKIYILNGVSQKSYRSRIKHLKKISAMSNFVCSINQFGRIFVFSVPKEEANQIVFPLWRTSNSKLPSLGRAGQRNTPQFDMEFPKLPKKSVPVEQSIARKRIRPNKHVKDASDSDGLTIRFMQLEAEHKSLQKFYQELLSEHENCVYDYIELVESVLSNNGAKHSSAAGFSSETLRKFTVGYQLKHLKLFQSRQARTANVKDDLQDYCSRDNLACAGKRKEHRRKAGLA